MRGNYSTDPTERGDQIAQEMRDYYEANKDAFQYIPGNADSLMLGLLCVVRAALKARHQSGDGNV